MKWSDGNYFWPWSAILMAVVILAPAIFFTGCGPSVKHEGVKTVTQKVNVYRNPDGKLSRKEFDHLTYGMKKLTITNHFGNPQDDTLLSAVDPDLDATIGTVDKLVYSERDGDHHFILFFSIAKHSQTPTLVLKGMR